MTPHGPMWPAEDNALDALNAKAERQEARRLWGAVMLTPYADVCESILRGRPVLVRRLDSVALRRALRGEPLPAPEEYLLVTAEHLDAVAEGGAFT